MKLSDFNFFKPKPNKNTELIPTKNTPLFSTEDVDLIIHPPQGINTKLNRQFTQIIAKLFKSQGYNITNIDGFEDNGGDLLLEKDSTKYAVQIKHYNPLSNTERIKPSDIQKFYATKKLTGVDRLIFLTTTYFYSHAIDKANDLGIELIDREQLFQLFAKLSPEFTAQIAYKFSIQDFPECPYCRYGRIQKLYKKTGNNKGYYYYLCSDCDEFIYPSSLKENNL
ncbi:restriction endonuclease [Listeria booriae]|uniref:restriction endonuclease n=1 Tax=Listeria booriae TaxID=1552123 RepID=UPI0016265AF3|nr:restriction endonuclease [Listeria booriae]MBC1523923.1 restriction endonuclease [Listeria booriae]